MTEENRYVRPELAGGSGGLIDPLLLVDTWLDELEELRQTAARQEGRPPADDLFDLLAAWARLQRVRPELIARLEGRDTVAWAEARLADLSAAQLRSAAAVFDPATWFREARRFEQSYEEWIEATDQAYWAQCILADLDDAELVLSTLEDRDLADDARADKVAECCAWVVDHADLFLAAGAWVQAVGETIRPDLLDFHPGLAITAEKFVAILDELEASQREMTCADVRPMDRRVLRALRRQACEELKAAAAPPPVTASVAERAGRHWWLPPVWQPPVAAAAERARPEFMEPLRWQSPDGTLEARLVLPLRPKLGEAERARLTFHRLPDGGRATHLADTPVRLAGLASTISRDGSAEFELGRLRQGQEQPVLQVGHEMETWKLLTRPEGRP
ncbi:MAG TPA: hypothetical protein EYH34_16445 [Planctomycetes bacterium]|nr:hypothetical protein [Planctomycetota bacterium]